MKVETLKDLAGVIVIYAMIVLSVIVVNARVDVPESNTQTISIEK